jgi:hypothetical protein
VTCQLPAGRSFTATLWKTQQVIVISFLEMMACGAPGYSLRVALGIEVRALPNSQSPVVAVEVGDRAILNRTRLDREQYCSFTENSRRFGSLMAKRRQIEI